jgi:hypothetical protein
MPSQEIVKWLEVAANAAKVLAVLAAGIWSVFLFVSLRQWSRGRIELQKLLVEREKTEQEIRKIAAELKQLEVESLKIGAELKHLEFENFRQAVIHLSMRTKQKKVAGDDGRYVLGTVAGASCGESCEYHQFRRDRLRPTEAIRSIRGARR